MGLSVILVLLVAIATVVVVGLHAAVLSVLVDSYLAIHDQWAGGEYYTDRREPLRSELPMPPLRYTKASGPHKS